MTDPARAVCFDLDGTLVRDGAAEAIDRTAQELARRHGFSADDILEANASAWRACWSEQGDRWMRGRLVGDALPRDIWHRTLTLFGRDEQTLIDEAVELHIDAERETFTIFEETVEVLDELRALGIRIGLITNGPAASQRAKLAAAGIEEFFDVVVASGDLGVVKPEAGIFRHALDALGVPASRAVHVGDNFDADVVGATDAGMRAVWINRDSTPAPRSDVPHLDSRSLRDVLDVVAQGSALHGR